MQSRFGDIWLRLQNPGVQLRQQQAVSEAATDQSAAEERERAEWEEVFGNAASAVSRRSQHGWLEAISHFETCLELRPEHAECAYSICCCYAHLKRPQLAMEWLKRAVAWGLAEESDSAASGLLAEVKSFQLFAGLREVSEFAQVRNILRRKCRRRAGSRRQRGRTWRSRQRTRRQWIRGITEECVDSAAQHAQDKRWVRDSIVCGLLLPAAMARCKEPKVDTVALAALAEAAETSVEESLLKPKQSSLKTIDELMQSNWMGEDGDDDTRKHGEAHRPPAEDAAVLDSTQSSVGDEEEPRYFTIVEIRNELRGRLGLGLADAHQLTEFLASLAAKASSAADFAAAVLREGGGVDWAQKYYASFVELQRQKGEKEAKDRKRALEALELEQGRQRAPGPGATPGPGRWRNAISHDLSLDVAHWTDGDLARWLAELGLERYARSFVEGGLNGSALVSVSPAELQRAGVSVLGHRKLMVKSLQALARRRRLTELPSSGTPDTTPGNSRPGSAEFHFSGLGVE